jgi:hypothetical protein
VNGSEADARPFPTSLKSGGWLDAAEIVVIKVLFDNFLFQELLQMQLSKNFSKTFVNRSGPA